MAAFRYCCGGAPENDSLKDPIESKAFSPILNLDVLVADYAYERLKKIHNDNKGLFEPRFPPRKRLDVIVNWDLVDFNYSRPKTMREWKAEMKKRKQNGAAANQSSDSNANTAETPLLDARPSNSSGSSAFQGDDPHNVKENESKEIFRVVYDNNTDSEIKDVKLTAERRIVSNYSIEVSRSLQVGHTLQVGLKSPESVGIEAGYEFSRMLTEDRNESKSEEVETNFHTETNIDVDKQQSAIAEVTTRFQTYKETVVIESSFSGTINVVVREKPKGRKNPVSRSLALPVGTAVRGMLARDKDLFQGFDLRVEEDEEETVHYISVVTLSSNTGVDRHINIRKKPLQ